VALTSTEQDLLDFALSGLPSWFQHEDREMEFLGGCAVLFGAVKEQVGYWLVDQALIGSATGATSSTPDWLGQHAADRDTRRQGGELDPALRARLKNVPDALHRQSILDAAQAIVDASGVVGDVAILEPLRWWRAFYQLNSPDTGVGGTFVAEAGNLHGFQPTVAFARPPLRTFDPVITYKLVLSGSANPANDGTFTISDLDEDAAVYTNAGGVAGADAGVAWRVDRYDEDDNLLTGGAGRACAYYDRGFRMSSDRSAIVLILPYGTTEGTRLSVLEMLRIKKAAGILAIVERRLNP
jgi:hypothetical protein